MINAKGLEDKTLLERTHSLIALERKTIKEILVHLQEIYDRKLFARMGYSSLIKFMVVEFKLSESSAYRRYQALKLAKEIPAAREMIANGSLSLCGATKLQTLMKGEDSEKKALILDNIQNKSTRECEQIIFDLCPKAAERAKRPDKVVTAGATTVRMEITMEKSTMDKFIRLKARTKKYNNADLLDWVLELAIIQTDPLNKKTRMSKGSLNPRTIPAKTKREVIHRAHGHCQYPGCKEIHFLEIDHINTVASGGNNHSENLRLFCKAHHQLATLNTFGREFTSRYF